MVLIALISLIQLVLSIYVFPNDGYSYNYPLTRTDCYMDVPSSMTYDRKPCTDEQYAQKKVEDQERKALDKKNNMNRDLAQDVALLIVGLPLLGYHWSVIRREHTEEV